ncbi:MAG: 3-oxoacyl-[acyl-carrier-protein] synthase [Candidatus Binatota bacterium]|nr:3-oxoacyl-[acyl-carrier-protein] synthase [Candidatus Binatota bacterium]
MGGGRSRIVGVGMHVPDHVVTNADLTLRMETTDEWVQQRTGIRERHHITEDTGAADLGAVAARQALAQAGLRAEDVDLILFATLSPDYDFPASACVLQRLLGVRGAPAIDVKNQCSGFVYGLAVADAFLRTGRARTVLLVGGEVHSTGIDLTTRGRDVGVIFGDGAGAVVLVAEPDSGRGILSTHLHAEGKYAEKLCLESAASRTRPRLSEEVFAGSSPAIFPRMDGRYVFKHAVTRFTEVILEALTANGLTPRDIDLLIPHQANLRISQLVAMGLELPEEKMFNNIERYGNTTAASIPIALCEALEAGKVRPGDVVCLAAFGAGFTWASALIRW